MENDFNATMHSQKKASLLIVMAEITGWVLLALYLVSFISDLQSLIPNFSQIWPSGDVMGQVMTLASLLFKPAMGLFYFVMMHGIAQLIALGIDIFFYTEDEDQISASAQIEESTPNNE